jgi:hypothetical protein
VLRDPRRPASFAALTAAAIIVTTSLTAQTALGPTGPGPTPARIYVSDPYVRDAVGQALRSAAEWLKAPKCQELLTEFSDQQGRALTERLVELRMSLAEYVDALIIKDGERYSRCSDERVLAFTAVGSRMIYVCGPAFGRAARRDAQEARAALVHELLHTLGLGENPPSPRQITHRVKQLCW